MISEHSNQKFIQTTSCRISSSFRDPSGFLFIEKGKLYRSIDQSYKKHYDHLMQSGLYDKLVAQKLLIPHVEVDFKTIEHFPGNTRDIYKIIQPDHIIFISYPYEWCFSELKNAALATIEIQKQAMSHGMILKDASAYNIQFSKGKPLLIDSLSFEIYQENKPWLAYRQFCQHFLAPLALMASRDIRLGQLMKVYIDGLPLDLASKMLPVQTWFKTYLLTHIHIHAKVQKRYSQTTSMDQHQQNLPLPKKEKAEPKVSSQALNALMNNLCHAISHMQWKTPKTEWGEYYEDTTYSPKAMYHKKLLVEAYLSESNPQMVWDLGANNGLFSRIATAKNIDTIAFDIDATAVEKNYLQMLENKETKILPLCLDLTNPSASIGWANEERLSLLQRGPVDMALALALIHHLAISNNMPFSHIAAFLSKVCRFLIIEFIPKNDSQVQRLLQNREDIFHHYDQNYFENTFENYFSILKREKIIDTQRIIYLMSRRISKE